MSLTEEELNKQNAILDKAYKQLSNNIRQSSIKSEVLIDNEEVYKAHAKMVYDIGNSILNKKGYSWSIGEEEKRVMKFLLLYFNGSEKALEVFPDQKFSLHKNILFTGNVGVGKTSIMEIFSHYLKLTNNKNHQFDNISVTQMINYYQKHGHIDAFTYRESGSNNFDGNPVNICLNDVGIATYKHFGTDTKLFILDFLFARNELWATHNKYAHITTNLTMDALIAYFNETITDSKGESKAVNRILDRFKTYNIITMKGNSKR